MQLFKRTFFQNTSIEVATSPTGLTFIVLGGVCVWVFFFNDPHAPLRVFLAYLTQGLTSAVAFALVVLVVAALLVFLPLVGLAAYLQGPDWFVCMCFSLPRVTSISALIDRAHAHARLHMWK